MYYIYAYRDDYTVDMLEDDFKMTEREDYSILYLEDLIDIEKNLIISGAKRNGITRLPICMKDDRYMTMAELRVSMIMDTTDDNEEI